MTIFDHIVGIITFGTWDSVRSMPGPRGEVKSQEPEMNASDRMLDTYGIPYRDPETGEITRIG